MQKKTDPFICKIPLLLAVFFFFVPHNSPAEIIQLKNGNAIETKILKEDDEFVTVEAQGGEVKIPKNDIKMLWRGTKEELLEVRGRAVYFAKGVKMYKDGRFKEASENFERALGPNVPNAVIYANLGSSYASVGEAQKAEESFLKALQGDLRSPDVLLNLANLYLSTQNFLKAEEVFREYLQKKPDDEIAKSGLANSYYALGQFKKAYDAYSSLKRAKEVPFLNNQAAALIQLGRLDEARSILEPLVSGHAAFVKPFLNLGEIDRILGQYDAAKRQYESVLAKEPLSLEAQIGLVKVYLEEKDFENAEEVLRKISEIDSENKNAKYMRAQLYIKRGELAKAAVLYEGILEKDPKNQAAGNNLGLLYLKMNDPKKALEVFGKVLEVDDRYAKGHANKGLAYAFLNDADKALKEWNRALEIDPDLKEAAQNKKLIEDAIRGEKVQP